MKTLVTTSKKQFPGGVTTAYVLDEGATYGVSVITRFDSGNYITNYKESGMQPAEALKTAEFYTR
jgi:hypothetical protein